MRTSTGSRRSALVSALALAVLHEGEGFSFGPGVVQGGRQCHSAWTRTLGRGVPLHGAQHEPEGESSVRLEDRGVPTAHRGLHDFLYGAEEDHGASGPKGAVLEVFDGKEVFDVPQWLAKYGESRHAAVYAVEGTNGQVTFVGLSRNVAISLASHVKNEGAENVARVRIHSYRFPRREEMEQLRSAWLAACPELPRGNTAGAEWASSIREAGAAAMTEDQRRAYEETKLKMRRAIADTSLIDEMDELSSEDIHRREMLQAAVEGDDWSAVINAQTAGTVDKNRAGLEEEAAAAVTAVAAADPTNSAAPAVVSPFAPEKAAAPAEVAAPQEEGRQLEFTVENVDKVLDEVRPYLISDGGNCAVVGVDPAAMTVSLALQGACGSCPSSTMTMKMGIERVLKENFPTLNAVMQVADPAAAAMAEVTTDIVEGILEPIRPAIRAMKGHVTVKSAFDGVVVLSYKGSPKIAYGIQLSLQDNPLIREVKFEDEAGKPIVIAR